MKFIVEDGVDIAYFKIRECSLGQVISYYKVTNFYAVNAIRMRVTWSLGTAIGHLHGCIDINQNSLIQPKKTKKKKLDKEGSSYSPLERPRSAIAE